MANLSEFLKEHKNAVVVGGVLAGVAVIGLFLWKCPLSKKLNCFSCKKKKAEEEDKSD